MTPGLAGGPPFPVKAKKGAIVAIASTDKPSVPLAVGTCVVDVASLGRVQGAKGHAVQTMHWSGDEIWSYSVSRKPGVSPPDNIPGWLQDDEIQNIAGRTEGMDIDDDEEEDGGVTLDVGQTTNVGPGQGFAGEEDKDEKSQEEESAQADVKEMTTKGTTKCSKSHTCY